MIRLLAWLMEENKAVDVAAVDVVQQAQVQVDELSGLVAFLRDRELAPKFGPKGWVQPPIEEYTAVDAPPSHLPVESVRAAVLAGVCPVEVLLALDAWNATHQPKQ